MAPFNRYQTLDVTRRRCERAAGDIALYTGNDDEIVADLLTRFRGARSPACVSGRPARPMGGLDQPRGRAARAGQVRPATPSVDAGASAGSPTRTPRSSTPRTLPRLHRRHSRGAAPPGAARRARCLDPTRNCLRARTEEIDRVTAPIPISGRRLRRRESRSLASLTVRPQFSAAHSRPDYSRSYCCPSAAPRKPRTFHDGLERDVRTRERQIADVEVGGRRRAGADRPRTHVNRRRPSVNSRLISATGTGRN